MPDTIVEPAPAKLNLDLYIESRRPDGYHDLDSVVAFTALGDRVEVSPADSYQLAIDGPFAAELQQAGETLIARAAELLAQELGKAPHVGVTLTKNLPLAAGLGGGSADAAAALRALWRLWFPNQTLADGYATLLPIATQLGADLPVCLVSRASRMQGIGDRLAAAPPVPALSVVLVNPRLPTPTGAVYRALDPLRFGPAPDRAAEPKGALPAWLRAGRNDLSDAACFVQPAIRVVLQALEEHAFDVVRLAGSGSTCFGLTADPAIAARAGAALATAHPGWWVRVTELQG